MAITYVKGDLLQALKNEDVDFIIHCCNSKGVMGSGIAKQIKEEFPDAYECYQESYNDYLLFKDNFLGTIAVSDSGVINLVGQESFGTRKIRYCNYGAIAKGLSEVTHLIPLTPFFESINFTRKIRVGIPYKFASDRAGGDWNIILELITGMLTPHLEVYIYHLEDLK